MGKKQHEMSLKWLGLSFDQLPLPLPKPPVRVVPEAVAAEAAVAFIIITRTLLLLVTGLTVFAYLQHATLAMSPSFYPFIISFDNLETENGKVDL